MKNGSEQYLRVRFARLNDRKKLGAAKRSKYYVEYGNPHYGGAKGLFSGSYRKRYESGDWSSLCCFSNCLTFAGRIRLRPVMTLLAVVALFLCQALPHLEGLLFTCITFFARLA